MAAFSGSPSVGRAREIPGTIQETSRNSHSDFGSSESAAAESIETVIFVDVDGVLNIGIRDPPQSPLSLDTDNVDKAFHTGCELSAKIVDVYKRQQEGQKLGGAATYSELVSDMVTGTSEVLLGRLAKMLHSAGKNRLVVLASSWRKPRHKVKVRCLEQQISRILGEPFQFDDRTQLCKDSSPAKRLECIGDYIASNCSGWHKSARVLVLEDFYISPLSGWSIGGAPVRGTADTEAYLKSRAPQTRDLSVMLVHTFDQWTAAAGLHVQIGSGLSQQQVDKAVEFINRGKEGCKASGSGLDMHPLKQLLCWTILSLKTFDKWNCNRSVYDRSAPFFP